MLDYKWLYQYTCPQVPGFSFYPRTDKCCSLMKTTKNLANTKTLQAINALSELLSTRIDLKFSILFGSRATGSASDQSDWDIAIFFKDNSNTWDNLGKKEEIRHQIAKTLKINDQDIDLVDLNRSSLSINATVIDDGIILSEQDSLALAYYYQGIWSKLEAFYWNLDHAA